MADQDYKTGKLHKKYNVEKVDGETDPEAQYFVLRVDRDPMTGEPRDPHAIAALHAYADSVRKVNRTFADELFYLAEYSLEGWSSAFLEERGFRKPESEDNDFICWECEKIIPEKEWEMFGGKCEECSIDA